MVTVEVRDVSKGFKVGRKNVLALQHIDLAVEDGEFFVLLGHSGSGKSTLLRCIAGLEEPEEGEILLKGEVIFSARKGVCLDPADRNIGLVFQSYAIWPHMSVIQNVAVPLISGRRRMRKSAALESARSALDLVQMVDFADRPASLLSGGQQQRVAVARALAVEPKILLMDEPLSNLDARLREQVRNEITSIAKKVGITVLYVTHDQIEAMAIASRIAIMGRGHVLQLGTPAGLYYKPLNVEVAQFMGSMNWLRGKVINGNIIETEIGRVGICGSGSEAGSHVSVGIRPEHVCVSFESCSEENEFEADLVSSTFLGDQTWYDIEIGSAHLVCRSSDNLGFKGRIFVRLPKEKIQVFTA